MKNPSTPKFNPLVIYNNQILKTFDDDLQPQLKCSSN